MTVPKFILVFLGSLGEIGGPDGCNHNAELVEHATDLRELKLLVGSGGLDFTKGSKGMDSLDKHVEQISFGP